MNSDRLFEIFMSGVSSGVNVVIFFAIIYYFLRFLEWGSERISKANSKKDERRKNGIDNQKIAHKK